MNWLRNNIIALFMALVVCLAAAGGYGAMKQQYRNTEIILHAQGLELEGKADKDAVMRELDQIHQQLTRIEAKIDGLRLLSTD